jgi:capsule biosynthesis phosphatase
MRICIDLDGVLCNHRRPGETYDDVEPLPGAVQKVRALRANGHTIILFTARHMKTCEGNVALAVARVGAITLGWLARHGFVFDEIHFGKPWADVYIDDNALRFESWDSILGDGSTLPSSTESGLSPNQERR